VYLSISIIERTYQEAVACQVPLCMVDNWNVALQLWVGRMQLVGTAQPEGLF